MKSAASGFTATRNRCTQAMRGGLALVGLTTALSIAPISTHAASPASANATPPVKLEAIPGSANKRITLTSKAAERLGIATGKVSMEPIVRKQMVGGLVIPALEKQPESRPGGGGFGGFGQTPSPVPGGRGFVGFQQTGGPTLAPPTATPTKTAATLPNGSDTLVLVTLSKLEYERLAKDKPARVLPLASRDQGANAVVVNLSSMPPEEDMRRSMLKIYYVAAGKDHGLPMNTRMRVELQLTGPDDKQKVVPYSALIYDPKGVASVYLNPEPLKFERRRVVVDRVAGDWAVLSDGPPVDTTVVTVGASLLYGTEVFGK